MAKALLLTNVSRVSEWVRDKLFLSALGTNRLETRATCFLWTISLPRNWKPERGQNRIALGNVTRPILKYDLSKISADWILGWTYAIRTNRDRETRKFSRWYTNPRALTSSEAKVGKAKKTFWCYKSEHGNEILMKNLTFISTFSWLTVKFSKLNFSRELI